MRAAVLLLFLAGCTPSTPEKSLNDVWGKGVAYSAIDSYIGQSMKGEGTVLETKDGTQFWIVTINIDGANRYALLRKGLSVAVPPPGATIAFRCNIIRANNSTYPEIVEIL